MLGSILGSPYLGKLTYMTIIGTQGHVYVGCFGMMLGQYAAAWWGLQGLAFRRPSSKP